MTINKLDEMVYALDLVIDRHINREYSRGMLDSLRDEIYRLYRTLFFPYCGVSMSRVIIRNELIAHLGEEQAEAVCNHLF